MTALTRQFSSNSLLSFRRRRSRASSRKNAAVDGKLDSQQTEKQKNKCRREYLKKQKEEQRSQRTLSLFVKDESKYGNINVPFFHHNNIVTGKNLGKGSFSKVRSIRKFFTDVTTDATTTTTTTTTKNSIELSSSSSSTPFLKRVGLSLLSATRRPSYRHKYALKMLRDSTLRKKESFVRAAARDLKNELYILSVLNHENIINVHGFGIMAETVIASSRNSDGSSDNENTTSISNGYDNIFLILDQLEYTLDKKIYDWFLYRYDCDHHNGQQQQYSNSDNYSSDRNSTLENSSNSHNSNDIMLREKINIALQVADALQYMHDRGYIYRDLKSQNIGLMHHKDPNMQTKVKLFDFGISRRLPTTTNTTTTISSTEKNNDELLYKMSLVGSPRYMAPELHNREKYNEKADVYSWSIVFYTMLTMQKPYRFSPKEHIERVCQKGERPHFFDEMIDNDAKEENQVDNDKKEEQDGNENSNINDGFNVASSPSLSSLHLVVQNSTEITTNISSSFLPIVPEELKNILKKSWEQKVSHRYSTSKVRKELSKYCKDHFDEKQNYYIEKEILEKALSERDLLLSPYAAF